jgi:hypothetical protein
MRSQEEAQFFAFLLRQNSFDFEKTGRVCRNLTIARKVFLSALPEYEREQREWAEGANGAAQKRREWLEKQSKP